MLGIASVLLVVALSLLVTRVASAVLTATGMSRELARFQARSAYTGVGFTTSEAEAVVAHPVRRRVVLTLMLLGNAGIATAVVSLVLGFGGADTAGGTLGRMALLIGGVAVLTALARSGPVERWMRRRIDHALARWTDLELRDYAGLLRVAGPYQVAELRVAPHDWLAGRTLRELRLPDEGVLVLGVQRVDGTFLGAPGADTVVQPDDTLLLYGRDEVIADLDQRVHEAGDAAHAEHAERHADVVAAEQLADPATAEPPDGPADRGDDDPGHGDPGHGDPGHDDRGHDDGRAV